MDVWVRNNEILRLTPRKNEEVNSYWMCDHGRLETFKHVNGPGRLNGPLLNKDGQLVEVGWDEAISKVVSELRAFKKSEIAGLGSAYATNEDNYLFQRLMKETLGTRNLDFVRHISEDDEDELLIRGDKTPNSIGAREVGVVPTDGGLNFEGILNGIKEGTIKALYVLDDNIAADPQIAKVLSNLQLLIVHSFQRNETTDLADIVLSSSTYAEKNGTFINFQGRIQRIRPSVTTLDKDRALDGLSMSRWDKFAAHNDKWGKGTKRDCRSTWRIIASIAAALGSKMKYNQADDVFRELSEKIQSFKGLTYLKIGSSGKKLELRLPTPTVPSNVS
jgi:NADH-quinone oxidoreductase subunit G